MALVEKPPLVSTLCRCCCKSTEPHPPCTHGVAVRAQSCPVLGLCTTVLPSPFLLRQKGREVPVVPLLIFLLGGAMQGVRQVPSEMRGTSRTNPVLAGRMSFTSTFSRSLKCQHILVILIIHQCAHDINCCNEQRLIALKAC